MEAKTTPKKATPPAKIRPSLEDYLMGKYLASRHPDFRKVKASCSDEEEHYMLKEAADRFEQMSEAASREKIPLRAVSAFRSFDRQKEIWESKYLGFTLVENKNLLQAYPNAPEKRVMLILKYSAAPGTSRHHWGTDLDINSVSPEYFETVEGKKVYTWLNQNAKQFGFFQPYGEGRDRGYQEEKWHWSFKPISAKLLQQYKENIKPEMVLGYQGSESLPEGFYEDYVFGINHECY